MYNLILNLYIAYLVPPSLIITMPKFVKEGDDIMMNCSVIDANPAIEITKWFKDGDRLNVPAVYSLINSSRSDAGNYTCTGSNTLYDDSVGTGSVTGHLDIQCRWM